MSTQLRVIERPDGDNHELPFWHPEGHSARWWDEPTYWGLMWRTPEYDVDGRESWLIVLPNGAGIWNTTDLSAIRGSKELGPMWGVTGEPPNITVTPSIDAGEWHGFINDGVMTP